MIDAAKTLNMLSANGGFTEEYQLYGKAVTKEPPLFIAIPTTSGTGAEATKTAVVINNNNHLKKSLYHTSMIADIAILDPTLTVELPKKITSATGMDALSHAIESYVSLNASPMTEMYGLAERPQLTNVPKLNAYFSAAHECGMRGARRASQLLKQVCDGAASPREAELEIALSRPRRLDGLGCPHALLNSKVPFDEFAASITGTTFGSIDLHYLMANYGLEYTGKEPHEWRIPEDVARQNALEHMGVEIAFVTTRQLRDARELELVAQKVSRKTRGYWRPEGLSSIERRQAFLDMLLIEREFPSGAGTLVV